MRTILFAGGGTLGPVTPLLAVAKQLREADPSFDFLWAGTDSGPERAVIESQGIAFFAIPIAKLPRYVSSKLLTLPIDFYRANRMSKLLIDSYHPKLVLAAGGFTAVPIVRVASKQRIPCITHQLDYKPLLSNRLIANRCRYVTTSFLYERPPFSLRVPTYQVPTPVRFHRSSMPSHDVACRAFGLDPARPVLLVAGGGTGAQQLNEALDHIEHQLPNELQIIHLTGKGKRGIRRLNRNGYICFDFLNEEMEIALAACDIVLSRAGIGALSEFAALSLPTILLPLPDSPQEQNVQAIRGSCISIDSKRSTWHDELIQAITTLANDPVRRQAFGDRLHHILPTDHGEALANVALSVLV